MFTISIDPVILHIGHFMLRWYGVIVMTAIVVGVWLAAQEAEHKGIKKEDVYDAAIWVVMAGIVGARIFHVIDHWPDEFAAQPIRILYVWEGGLAIWGGVIGGLIAAAILARRRGWRIPVVLDAAAPGLVLGKLLGELPAL